MKKLFTILFSLVCFTLLGQTLKLNNNNVTISTNTITCGFISASNIPAVSSFRIIEFGTNTINANSGSDIVAVTRNTNESVSVFSYATNDIDGVAWHEGGDIAALTDEILLSFQRTGTPNQFKLVGVNTNLISSRTIEWIIIGIKP